MVEILFDCICIIILTEFLSVSYDTICCKDSKNDVFLENNQRVLCLRWIVFRLWKTSSIPHFFHKNKAFNIGLALFSLTGWSLQRVFRTVPLSFWDIVLTLFFSVVVVDWIRKKFFPIYFVETNCLQETIKKTADSAFTV